MKKFGLLLFLAIMMAAGCKNVERYSPEDEALRKEIGQMLLVGFRGTELDEEHHIVRDIRDYNIGGVILFEYDVPSQSRPRNISSPGQLKNLCSYLQGVAGGTLLIGIDQEGGMVTRLKQNYGFPYFASAASMSAAGTDSARYYARLTASTLAEAGINLNFAPCVDVNINPQCPVIGKIGRSFGESADRVAEFASIWVEEQQRQGVTACLKHFPGHGSSKKDTHLGLADVSDTWQPSELEVYRMLLRRSDIRMVMTTHVFNAKLDNVYPATLSKATLNGLLRDSLGFDGVVITDDMAMGAMTQQYEYEDMLRLAIMAGADMLCISNNGAKYDDDVVPRTVDMIYNMVKEGKIDIERIHESAARVARLKSLYLAPVDRG